MPWSFSATFSRRRRCTWCGGGARLYGTSRWIPGNHDTDFGRVLRQAVAKRACGPQPARARRLRGGHAHRRSGGVFRGQIWMPDGNPNYYSPATFMRRVGQATLAGRRAAQAPFDDLPVLLRQPSEAEGRHSRDTRGSLVSQEGLLRTRQACQDDGREVAFPRAPARGPRLRHAGLDSHPCSRLQTAS